MTEAIYRTIGAAIRRKREKAGLTAKELGELVGLSRETIRGIEAARQRCQLHNFVRINDALDSLIPPTLDYTGSLMNIPADIRHAAKNVGDFFRERNIKDWKLYSIQSRS